MREFKFRAWLENREEMYKFDEDDPMGEHFNRLDYGHGKYVLMQYTGLKDKNGKEIYESDIVANEKVFTVPFKVVWNPDGAWFVHDNKEWPCYYLRQVNEETEIIGNMYENPELLKD